MPRTFGPALGSVVVGIALGIITIIGVAQFSEIGSASCLGIV